MKHAYIDLSNQNDLIQDLILRKLVIHKDSSGSLVETLRADWSDVVGDNFPFAMQYMSTTPSGIARDEGKWHVHKDQVDRFICVSGRIVTATYDSRPKSPTHGKLNLFIQGPQKEEEMFLLLIPKEVAHAFLVISKEPAYLLNLPTQLYNPDDEGRVDNKDLNWQDVRDDFGI